ncbi:MAG: zinc ABC transporter substrate-binding protein [Candidatus Sumerlaeales bacterium]|nr:zinc ABC transporter substrate-binding protein [Candidatus Sumerlaeales bacterium]
MRHKLVHILYALAIVATANALGAQQTPVAVSSSYLECAVAEITSAPIVRLTGSTGCPGHFDLKPSDAKALSKAKLFFCLDTQEDMGTKLKTFPNLRIIPIHVPEGMMVPTHYTSARKQIADALKQYDPETSATAIDARLEELRPADLRLSRLGRAHIRGLIGKNVLASKRQSTFCRWLWMNVVGEFGPTETVSIAELTELARNKNVEFVIGNKHEGDTVAKALAEQLNVPLVMFANFPDMSPQESTWKSVFMGNIKALTATAYQAEIKKRNAATTTTIELNGTTTETDTSATSETEHR